MKTVKILCSDPAYGPITRLGVPYPLVKPANPFTYDALLLGSELAGSAVGEQIADLNASLISPLLPFPGSVTSPVAGLQPCVSTTLVVAEGRSLVKELLEAALQRRAAALARLTAAEKNLAEAQSVLQGAMDAANKAQQVGMNSVAYRQAQQAVQRTYTVVGSRAEAVLQAQADWDFANAIVLNLR